jgi:hypothetical protein
MRNGKRVMTRRRQQPGEIEWLRYGTRENTHEEEKNSSYKTWEMTKEPWQEEGNNLKKWNDHLKIVKCWKEMFS